MTNALLARLVEGEDLSREETHDLMHRIMSGQLQDAQIAAILTALRMKGETVAEIAGFAAAMREKAVPVAAQREGLIDTCGTGGDGRDTFNISTATALVVAAMGIPVAKHGNRAVSSRSGSADVLEALGVNINLDPPRVAALIDQVGIGFLFAPQHHPAMRYAAPARKQLGIRTVFNILGPLTNPAGVRRQLIGVFDRDLTEVLCGVLRELGAQKAFVVHGMDGTDEVSLCGETQISALRDGTVDTYRFTPEDAGLERADLDALAGGSAAENAALITGLLRGTNGPRRDVVLLNAAFAAQLADRAPNTAVGVTLAADAIDTGGAFRLLEALRAASHELAE
jgi:anthranilate phosphoribosyltransferase